MDRLTIILLTGLASVSLQAQWLNQPTVGIPRTADGKVNLKAPAPRTADGKPDLSGLWGLNAGAYAMNVAADLKASDMQPWADALYKQRMESLGKDDPVTYRCLPQGPRANSLGFLMSKIIQTPGLIVILSEDLSYRQIFLDGRELPKDPNPSFMGYSVGHWEGDTLVVESNGFNATTWLDFGGHPHSEALRMTERFRRSDFGHLEIEETLSDPEIYSKPMKFTIKGDFVPDTEIIEFICAENEKDFQHLVGKASDDLKLAVKVAPEILAKYVGTYEFTFPENPTIKMLVNITLADGKLYMDLEGKDKALMTPLSPTLFSALGDRNQFVVDERGVVTHMEFIAAEGNLRAVRKP